MLGNNRRSLFHFNNYYSFSMRESLFDRKKEEKYPKYREDTSIREEERDPLSFLLKHCETLQSQVNIDNVIEIFPSLNICVNVRCISIVSNSKYLERLSKARYASWLNFKRIEGEGDWRDTTNLLQYERILLCSNDLINSPSCVALYVIYRLSRSISREETRE